MTSCRVVNDDKSMIPLEPIWMGMKVAIYTSMKNIFQNVEGCRDGSAKNHTN